jgi:hypothetical protein
MGNVNVTGDATEYLEIMKKEDNRTKSGLVNHLIIKEFRSRKVVKDENERGQ